jgi:hypothetical protein
MMPSVIPRFRQSMALVAMAFWILWPGHPSAHEVPSELTVEAFVKPVQSSLQLLIRIPLSGLMGTGMPKEGVGYLALDRVEPSLQQTAQQIASAIDIYEDRNRLAAPRVVRTRISLPFDASFESYEKAMKHMAGPPLPVDTQVYWLQGYFDVLLEYPIRSDRSDFSVHTRLTSLAPQVTTSLRFLPADASVRSFEFVGDAGRVWLDPHWYQAARTFVKLGFLHTLGVWEQWMFVLCILIPSQRLRSIVPALITFAAAYALAGLVVVYGPDSTGPWLAPLVQTITAGLLVLLALQNIAMNALESRSKTAAAFGVASGVAYSMAMRGVVQFGGHHPLLSVLSFDAGIAFGQLLATVLVGLALALVSRFFVARRMRTIIMSAMVANVTWNSFTERAAQLPNLQWPLPTPANLITLTSWLLVIIVAAGTLWLLTGLGPARSMRARHHEQDEVIMKGALPSTGGVQR